MTTDEQRCEVCDVVVAVRRNCGSMTVALFGVCVSSRGAVACLWLRVYDVAATILWL